MESAPLPPPEGSAPPAPTALTADERNMGMFCHLIALAGLFVPFVGNIVGPLILWIIKKDTMPYVDYHGKESLNFNITVSIAAAVCLFTFWLVLPLLLLVVIAIAWLVFTIMAALKASEGQRYQYPLTLRLVK